jgi:hypothetical protein
MTSVAKAATRAPFVTGLRSRTGPIDLSRAGEPALTIRVEMPDVWDVVRVKASANEPVVTIKRAALDAFCLEADPALRSESDEGMPEEFVMKLRGWEVLDESASLTDAGAIDGSIFLLTYRRRRPVR